jgi:hypothetical protein
MLLLFTLQAGQHAHKGLKAKLKDMINIFLEYKVLAQVSNDC